MEGICTSDERLRKLVMDKTKPQSRDEREIAGYRDVLNTIHENYSHIPVKATYILQLHRDLYKFEDNGSGGHYKNAEVEQLCKAFERIRDEDDVDLLLIIPMFILDFLCIHPFGDGNGRISRLWTLLLLYQAGYFAGRYISVERLIEQSKESYYQALAESSVGW